MELGDRTVMLLGGSGLVGHAVALDPYRGSVTIGSDLDWNAIEPEDAIEPSRFATWGFTVEEKGARIKR